ncbi:MAG: hypothetical protein ACK5E5_00455 [Bacteroidota bacterium]
MQLFHLELWTVLKRHFLCLALLLLVFCKESFAQPETGVKSIDIISSYKPNVRKFTKFQFLPNLPNPDTSRISLRYSIPTQGWQSDFVLQPVLPLAYQKDSIVSYSSVYIKAGFGNFSAPYLRAHLSRSKARSDAYAFTVFHQSARGREIFQRFGQTALMASGTKKLSGSPNVLNGKIDFNRDVVYRYGVPAGVSSPLFDSVKRVFTKAGASIGINRTTLTEFGIQYQGDLLFNTFFDQQGGREMAVEVRLPIQKFIEENWSVGIDLNAQSIQLTKASMTFRNSAVGLFLGLKHASGRLNFTAGMNPVWDRSGGQILPQVSVSYQLDSNRLMLTGGWEGKFIVNSYQRFFSLNNWLNSPTQLFNTTSREAYIGLKGSLSPYFSYAIQGSSFIHQSMPLFVNDTFQSTTKNSFYVVYEPRLVQLQLKGEVNYHIGQRVHLFSALQFNNYGGLTQQKMAWGLIPLEWRLGSKVSIGENLFWQTDLLVWRGAPFIQVDGKADRLKGAADLTTQLEFKFAKSWQVWTRFGNLFNQTYQRWAQYPVYGFNFMAGVVFSPEPKRKS